MVLTESLFNSIVYESAKKILKIDPFRSAIDRAIDDLKQEKQFNEFELREIDRNREKFCNNIYLTDETTFLKTIIENGVLPETASKLYKKFSLKFKENIKEAALKEPEVFFSYAMGEFEKNKKYKEELIELLTKFALEINTTLERIIYEIKELKKISINIPDIQEVLRRKETFEGEFFRKEPVWVDYKNGFIVERKEVDEIIKKLENNKIQLVLGAPASGKSIILKNVGYKLADKNKVYVVELKKHPQDEIKLFFDNIPKTDEDSPIFIIDDAHLYLSDCERLIRNFRSNGKGNLIIGSRKTREITEEHPKECAEYELLSELSRTCIQIQAEDVTEGMIRTFLGKQYRIDEDKITIISSNLDIYKNDLWFLSWALKAYNKDKKSVDIDEIYGKITSSIENIRVGKEKEPINTEDVFLPLSIFYQFEIPIERYFLEEQLGIDGNIINKLIGLQEIEETKEEGHKMLSLHHSSLADLYFCAYKKYSSFGKRIKKKILNGEDEKDLEFCLFYRYMTTTDSRNAVDVAIYLGRNWVDKKGGITLLENLIEKDKIKKLIENGIDKEEDIEKVGSCIAGIARASKGMAKKLADFVSAKINKEEDIEKIGYCVSSIAGASEGVALKLLEKINIDSLISKIVKEEDIGNIGLCISSIAEASQHVAMKLVETINIDSLSSKIDTGEDIKKVGSCISSIARVSKEAALKLADFVSAKINKEEDIGNVGYCMISIAGHEVGMKIANGIDIDALSSKINKEEGIMVVWLCVAGFTMSSKEVGMKLANSIDIDALSSKINKEGDIEKVGSSIGVFAWASKEVGMKLANSIDIDALYSKIDKEEDIKKVGSCVKDIARASEEVGNEILNHLNPKLREEVQKRISKL